MIKLFMQCITVISDKYKNNQKYVIMLFTIRSNKQKQEKNPRKNYVRFKNYDYI